MREMKKEITTTECVESGVLFEEPYFREDYLAQYRYDPETNEVVMYFKKPIPRLEATVLIELLASLIIDVSIVQSSVTGVNEE